MTTAEALDAMLADAAFTAPVTVEDCVQVRDALRVTIPGTSVECFHRHNEVVVRVDDIRRILKVNP